MTVARGVGPITGSLRAHPFRALTTARVAVAVPVAVIVVAVLDYVFALLRPGTREQIWLFWTIVWGVPLWFSGALLLIAVPATVLVCRRAGAPRGLVDGLLVAEFTGYCFGSRISPPTGDQLGWWHGAATSTVAASEALAEIAHKIPFWVTHDLDAVRFVSPVFGVLTIAAYLILIRRVAATTGIDRDLLRVFAIATPLPFWFVTGYIENTFLALPFLLLAFERLLVARDGRRSTLVQAAVLLGLAAAVHLLSLVMVGGALVFLVVRSGQRWRSRLADLATVLPIALAVPAAVIGLLLLTPLDVHPGNTNGGYDKQLLTPFVLHPGGWPNRFTMVSHAHLIEIANIVVHAAPVLVLALPVLLVARRGRVALAESLHADHPAVLLGCLSSAYLAFVAVFGFDYGPVGDLDLMLVLSVPLSLLVLLIATRLLQDRPGLLAGLVVGSAFAELAFFSIKVATAWSA